MAELGPERKEIEYTQPQRRAGKTHNNWYSLYDAAMLSFTSYTKAGMLSLIHILLEKAWHLATTGRPGPVWLDIPVNFQGGYIETDELRGYDPAEDDAQLPPSVDDATIRTILEKIKNAKRPVFHAGYGIRLSGGYAAFRSVAEKLNIDVYKRQAQRG